MPLHIHDYSTGEQPAEGEQTWTTEELQRDFNVTGFSAPYVTAVRRSDGVKGTLEFAHSPRIYFDWREA